MAKLSEDERIELIAHAIRTQGHAQFMTDVEPGDAKSNRYLEKLKKLVPDVVVLGRNYGPVPNVETVRVGRHAN